MFFRAGYTYYAGMDKPFYVSSDSIVEELQSKLGFRVISFWECKDRGLPILVPGKCGEDYDFVGIAVKNHPSQVLEAPSQLAWLVELPPHPTAPVGPLPPGTPQPTPPPPAPPAFPQPSLPRQAKTNPVAASALALVIGVGATWAVFSAMRQDQ